MEIHRRESIQTGSSDSAHDYIGKNFRLTILACFAVVVLFTFFPNLYQFLLPISFLENNILIIIGTTLLFTALVWVLVAQVHMQKSWRIGIDEDVKTELVQNGLFKISRNPIFLGVRLMLLGLFLIIPNTATFTILITDELLIQAQVRLEEEFSRAHMQIPILPTKSACDAGSRKSISFPLFY